MCRAIFIFPLIAISFFSISYSDDVVELVDLVSITHFSSGPAPGVSTIRVYENGYILVFCSSNRSYLIPTCEQSQTLITLINNVYSISSPLEALLEDQHDSERFSINIKGRTPQWRSFPRFDISVKEGESGGVEIIETDLITADLRALLAQIDEIALGLIGENKYWCRLVEGNK